MKQWITTLLILLYFPQYGNTQSLSEVKQVEYFFNKDTGVGTGKFLLGINAGDTVIKLDAFIPVNQLSNGIHTMYVRAKSNDGWSQYVSTFFYINQYIISSEPNVDSAEYFVDSDPGPGNAIPLSVGVADTVVSFTRLIPVGSVSPGMHTMCIRIKNAGGKWSHFLTQLLYVTNSVNDMPAITGGEYFVDHDPGIGAAQTIGFNFSTTGNVVAQTFNLPVPTGLNSGIHYMYIRVKDTQGHWSHFQDTLKIFSLPVTGLTLTAIKQNNKAIINWRTLTESNTNRFEVEKSVNGIEFIQIGNVKAKGYSNSSSEYSLTDDKPVAGLNFYRIKQVDNDGKYMYSMMTKVWFDKESGNLLLYPNPATNVLNIQFRGRNTTAFVNLFDEKGQWIKLYQLPVSNNLQIVLNGLPKGTYTVHVSNGLIQQTGKFVKQ